MRRRILEYLNRINRVLAEGGPETDWDALLDEHLVQIRFFQHERLIHLIVTVTFALVLMLLMSMLYFAASVDILMVVLFVFATIFLVLYVGHYYILETSVQKMYLQYDQILQKKTGRIEIGAGQNAASKS